MTLLFGGCYAGKKVLVTGNTGFKGSWLTTWLLELGAQVYGISKDIPTQPESLFEDSGLAARITYHEVDIRDGEAIKSLIISIEPDFVFHLAAQPIVLRAYKYPVETMATNVMGTVHILEALRALQTPCVAVMITSDKCYDNVEWIWGYREADALGGKDPYSASKGAAELMIKTYYHSYFAKPECPVRISAVRAGNVIGGGDWAESRIVPDCIRAWRRGMKVEIRSPHSTRPWQHVLEPISGYLQTGFCLSQHSTLSGEAFNFGPNADQNHTVLELIHAISETWGGTSGELYEVMPSKDFHEAGLLKLNCDKALAMLQWKPVMDFGQTAFYTASWYKRFSEASTSVYELTVEHIQEYMSLAQAKGLTWTL